MCPKGSVKKYLPITRKNEDDLKNEDNLKNEDDLKNEDYFKNENDLKNEDDLLLLELNNSKFGVLDKLVSLLHWLDKFVARFLFQVLF